MPIVTLFFGKNLVIFAASCNSFLREIPLKLQRFYRRIFMGLFHELRIKPNNFPEINYCIKPFPMAWRYIRQWYRLPVFSAAFNIRRAQGRSRQVFPWPLRAFSIRAKEILRKPYEDSLELWGEFPLKLSLKTAQNQSVTSRPIMGEPVPNHVRTQHGLNCQLHLIPEVANCLFR